MQKLDTSKLTALRRHMFGSTTLINGPWGDKLMLYADYTASGQALDFIEEYLLDIQQLYANSHTEDDATGQAMTQLLHDAETQIKKHVNAGIHGRIISSGSGATAAIDKVQQIIGVSLPPATHSRLRTLQSDFLSTPEAERMEQHFNDQQPVIFVGPYEHHSNEISWREGLATVVEVSLDDEGSINLAHLQELLENPLYMNRLRIGSFSAASNVTGLISPVYKIASLLHQHDALAFFDYAASAPYVQIDMNPTPLIAGDLPHIDAIFLSPHKFIGGPGSSGVLVFNQNIYQRDLPPSIAGGGTVDYVGLKEHDFINDIEEREKAGTPGILQTIKAALAMQVKDNIGVELIKQQEHMLIKTALDRWLAHPKITVLGNPDPARRVGIISFNVQYNEEFILHPRFVTRLLNDLFGIQSRAGCSCAGPYGHRLLDINEQTAQCYRHAVKQGFSGIKPGWCRVGLHYLFDQSDLNYLCDCIEFIADHGYKFQTLYTFEISSGEWHFNGIKPPHRKLELHNYWLKTPSTEKKPCIDPQQRAEIYKTALQQAKQLLQSATLKPGQTISLDDDLADLQFFLLYQENLSIHCKG